CLGALGSEVTMAPLLTIWLCRSIERLKPVQIPEVIALLVTVMLVGQIAFLGKSPFGSSNQQPLEYVAILPLLWAAFRFGTRGAITTAVLLSGIALWGTRHGFGPFAILPPNEALLMLQAFMGTMTLTSLILALVISDRERA